MQAPLWDMNGYRFEGRPGFLVSGEMHYFRVPRQDWTRRLDLLKAAGANCVATYIPWILHEPAEGDFRLGDVPYRHLEAFLELCREKELLVVCRPGPYQYSEMRYCGLPSWLCETYPEILARDETGAVRMSCAVSYLHPVFLEKTRRWFSFICPVIARHCLSRGGAVAFVQIDNELMGIHEWFGGWDYSPQGMDIGGEDSRYARFLKERYPSLAALNAACQTGFAAFAEATPTAACGGEAGRLRLAKDYQDFYFASVARYARLLADWMREDGIDCALIHNSGNGTMNPYFRETLARFDGELLLGVDLYYSFHMDSDANNPTPQLAAKAFLANETLRLLGQAPTCLELQAGNCNEWPPIRARDLAAWYYTNVAFGMKGLNYYVFTGGYNPEDIGGDGNLYDYEAPVGPDGDLRPSYAMLKEFGGFLEENAWLEASERVCDLALALDWEQARSKYYDTPKGAYSAADAWEFLRKGLLMTSLCASRAPLLVDLEQELAPVPGMPLLVAAGQRMSRMRQQRLADYVARGGALLMGPVLPTLDEDYTPCALLAEALGAACEAYAPPHADVCGFGLENIPLDSLWQAARLPQGAVPLLADRFSGAVLGWGLETPQGGRVLWLGCAWRYQKRAQHRLLQAALEWLGAHGPAVECDSPYVWAVLRRRGARRMLFLINLFVSPQTARVRLRDGGGSGPWQAFELEPMQVRCVAL